MIKDWIKRENAKGNPLGKLLYKGTKKYSKSYYDWVFYKNECRKIRELFSSVTNTPPFKCNVKARVEVHSLVSHKHLYMYILAIKSFLRFYDNVLIIAHDDGTLNRADIKSLKKHIGNIKLVSIIEANKAVKDILKTFPLCSHFRRMKPSQKQIFDFLMLSKENKLITLDSDTLFLDIPHEIIKWIESEEQKILYIYEEDPNGPKINGKPITNTLNIGKTPFKFAPHLCGGFVCYFKDIMNLNLVEEYWGYIANKCKDEHATYFSQPIMALYAGNSKYPLSIMPKGYQNPPYFTQNPVFKHYWSSISISTDYLLDAQKVIAQLKIQRIVDKMA